MLRLLPLIGLVLGLAAVPAGATAAVLTSNDARNAAQPKELPATSASTLFGAIRASDEGHYFSMTTDAPAAIDASLGVRTGANGFVPQIVVFQPADQTIGPTLPIVQPPQTSAYVYPGRESVIRRDLVTSRRYVERLAATIEFPAAGTYVIAVYNAGTDSGRYRLEIRPQGARAEWSMLEPLQLWWLGHYWLGIPVQALTAAALVLFGVLWVWYRQRIWFQSRTRTS